MNAVAAEKTLVLNERAPFTVAEEREILGAATAGNQTCFIGAVPGRSVGVLDVGRRRWQKNALVGGLGISLLREYRGIGLGSALMRRGIEWARAVGIRKLTLGVFATNDRAFALLTKWGFAEEARLKGAGRPRRHPSR